MWVWQLLFTWVIIIFTGNYYSHLAIICETGDEYVWSIWGIVICIGNYYLHSKLLLSQLGWVWYVWSIWGIVICIGNYHLHSKFLLSQLGWVWYVSSPPAPHPPHTHFLDFSYWLEVSNHGWNETLFFSNRCSHCCGCAREQVGCKDPNHWMERDCFDTGSRNHMQRHLEDWGPSGTLN